MSETLTITIDGKECTCEKGEYLYDVAKRNGIFIPVLCRSDAFADHRACCRVCIVEVTTRGRTKIVTSCIYPVNEPCEVQTQSDEIKEERAVIFALLHARAPESQRITEMNKWLGGTGFDRLVTLDNEKCVLCGLCVQACASLGTGAISTINRGTEKMIDTPYGKPSEYCVGCLSCANVCPTGAISFSENEDTRTIWNRTFELQRCEKCGKVMGTRESVAHSVKGTLTELPTVCDECKKRETADALMKAYRNA